MEDIPGHSGVYMHILYRRSNPDHFWLYVGQALVLVVRILTHNDKAHRQANPSLHYHIWDSASDIESAFVILAKHHITQNASPDDRFILNFQEMWTACIFQTMTPKHLAEYLPDDISKAWAGQHLNVVPPIWQGFTDNISVLNEAIGGTEAFTTFINSTDPAIRAWAWDLRYAFHDLRNSPNLSHRSYYFNIMLRNRNLPEEACDRRKIAYLQSVLHGKLRIVMGGNDGQNAHRVSCSDFEFTISRRLQLGLKVGDEVMLQFQLTETLNPEMYATKASIRDPASRLAVSIKGKGANVDALEGCLLVKPEQCLGDGT
ncbi:hypothetical protein BDV24DRAFT_153797 [Aspergillus arachidicola]|uniref:Uncharacterized protein n=1 Tax=Aspergillus arachidicola TaxID=656916 RepID=A0A5N6XY29_9EURO|nr:hypothetical protein BDV24DRAFT_153797 [Aspergillus arachidicola]